MLSKRKLLFLAILLIILILVLLFVYNYRRKIGRIISPFFLAIVISYLVHPLVIKLEEKKIPRTTGIILVYSGILLVSAVIIVFIVPELIDNTKQLINALPDIISEYQKLFNNIISSVRKSRLPDEIKEVMFKEIDTGTEVIQNYIVGNLKKALAGLVDTLTVIFDILLAMVIAYYFIKDSDLFKSIVLSLIPKKWRKGIALTGKEIHFVLLNFIQGQLLTALIIGFMEVVGLILLKVKYPLVLGLIGGIANVIPYFGPIIGAIPAVAIALVDSPLKAVWTVILFVAVQQIDNVIITPKIVEGRVGLHPVATIMAVLIGGEFFGITGMLVAVPATAILRIIVRRAIETLV
ncbi:MAG: AI-2E family transporter [Firmicutes bacterium]|nr:AI-2E family transporter [Bacillota bacterium]